MEIEKPDWLTDDFIKNALKDCDRYADLTIQNFDIKSAIPKGNNYTSDIIRVKIYFNTSDSFFDELKTVSLIVKAPIVSGGSHQAIFEIGIIEREYKIYYEFLPKLLKIFHENDEHVTAKCLPSDKENVIVMEDLNSVGYKLLDRFEQLDYNHAEIVLRNLAKFHAASVKLVENEPKLIEKFGSSLIFNKKNEGHEGKHKLIDQVLGRSQLKYLGREIESWPESKQYAHKIYKLMDKVMDIQYDLFEAKTNEFNVFNHGDLWSSNMLFKYSQDGLPQNVKFLDLQITCYCNPVLDLFYFIYSSIQFDVICEKLKELLTIYLDDLNIYLEKYGSTQRLSQEEFQKSMDEKDIFGFLTTCRILLFVFADKDKIIDFKEENIGDEDDNRLKSYLKSKKFRSVFPKFLDYFSKKTWFENL